MAGRSIIYLVNSLSTGGAEVQVVELARRMKGRGWDVSVVTLLDTADQKGALESAGIPHVSLGMRRGWPNPLAVYRLARVLRERRPDVLHTHMVQSNLLGRVARLFAPVPALVSTSHSINEGRRWRYRAYRATAGLADLVTAVSAPAARRHTETGATPEHKLRVVPNGIDTARFSFDAVARERLRRDEGVGEAFCWLAVGRFEEAKDYPNMLRAFARVIAARPESLLLIAGHGPLQDDARKLAEQLGLSQRVRFLGLRRDVPGLMSAADGYVMSSAWEGLPMVLLEATATGLPIVATRVGGIPEAVIDGKSGLLVPPGDDAALGGAMLNLMRLSVEERKRMSAAGSAHAKANFDIESITTRWESIYGELLSARGEGGRVSADGHARTTRLLHVTTVPMSLMFFRGQIGYMKSHGFEIEALSSPGPELAEFGAREGVATHAVNMPRQLTPLRDLVAVVKIWRRVRRVRPAIVHAHTPKGGLLGTIAAYLARVPVRVYHVRGLPFMTASGWRRRLLVATERASCRLAHRVLCVSHSLREVAIAEGLCPAEKIKVLAGGSGNGVDACGRFDPARLGEVVRRNIRAAYGIPADATVVGFVGRLVRDKGVVELTGAWRGIRERHPEAHLLVVGPFEERDAIPEEVAGLLRGDERVHLTGMQTDLPPLYAAMDVVVLPTYREGFPNVPLEGAAMGLPVVATRVPGCTDAVADGVTGTLVPARDAGALEAAVSAYLADGDLRRRHGEAGRQRVLRDFRQEVIWEALHQEYRRLLAERSVGAARTGSAAAAAAAGHVKTASERGGGAMIKRTFDLFVSLTAGVLLLPVMAVVAVLVRVKLGSPVLFRQRRPGLRGRPFVMYKFRTMTDERDERGELLADEKRLTRFGRFLRASSLDELPELINVIKGDMSLVGPRPLLMEYLERYTPRQARRHEVRPGITGHAQVNGRNALSWEEKFELDVWYVEHRSLWVDVRILFKTVATVLRREGISQEGKATAEPFRGAGCLSEDEELHNAAI